MPGKGIAVTGKPSIGFFGKLPVMGDFVTRRLPLALVEKWDSWLQDGLARSRELLGEQWLKAYLVAPVWRFCLQPGVVDAGAWCGLMFPSVDRVGRYFPLAMFAPLARDTDLAALIAGQAAWFDRLEALALQSLSKELQFDAWDNAIKGFPLPLTEERESTEDTTVPLGQAMSQKCLHFIVQSHIEFGRLIAHHAHVNDPPRAWWWQGKSKERRFDCGITEGLPGSAQFAALIDEQWEARGWLVKQFGAVEVETIRGDS
jgi:type VI secretion system protein ImpM